MLWRYRDISSKEGHVTKPEMGHWTTLSTSIRSKKHPIECNAAIRAAVGPAAEDSTNKKEHANSFLLSKSPRFRHKVNRMRFGHDRTIVSELREGF